jgi:hypothetical protein
MKKLVIANSGKGGQGKSTSIREVFNQLRAKYPTNVKVLIDDGDIKATIDVNGCLVGIESQGDPNSRMQESINDFIANECPIIVAACRTKWATYDKIVDLKTTNGYDIIWSPNDKTEISQKHKDILNDMYAKRIIQIIEDRIAGII